MNTIAIKESFRRIAFWGGVLAMVLLPPISVSQSPAWDVNVVTLSVDKLVSGWEHDRQVNVDPRAAAQIANEAMHFITIFGFDYTAVGEPKKIPEVVTLIDDEDAMRRIIYRYLDDAMTLQELRSIMERMANLFGQAAEMAGWPGEAPNPYKLVDFSDQLPNDDFVLLSDGKKDSSLPFRRFLVLPGDHRISNAADSWEFVTEHVSGARLPSAKEIQSTR